VRPKVIQIAIRSGYETAEGFDDGAVYLLYDNGDVYTRYNTAHSDWERVDLPTDEQKGNVE
jgi:hypothetical protein